jgi:hypothetical protein
MFLCDDSAIEFTPQPGVGAPVWRGRAASGEVLKDFAAPRGRSADAWRRSGAATSVSTAAASACIASSAWTGAMPG